MNREFLESLELGEGLAMPEGMADAILAEHERELEELHYGYAVRNAVSGLRFTSESARKSFERELNEKKLPWQDGTLEGLNEFTEAFRQNDPAAFVSEQEDKMPVFSRRSGSLETDPDAALKAAFGL